MHILIFLNAKIKNNTESSKTFAFASLAKQDNLHDHVSICIFAPLINEYVNMNDNQQIQEKNRKAEIIGIRRHCLGTDGDGVSTLIAFHGCLLRCKYCLNPQCHSSFDSSREKTPDEIMDILKKDELYFIATEGGVTFGGGEPLLKSEFIKDVMELGAKEWHTTLETSLCAERTHLERLMPYIDEYIVDVKDMNDKIYESYTGRKNDLMKSNLKYLIDNGKAKQITCRLPLIPGFNTDADRDRSEDELIGMGITCFDRFSYVKKDSSIEEDCHQRKRITLADIRERKKRKEKERSVWDRLKKGDIKIFMTKGIIFDD